YWKYFLLSVIISIIAASLYIRFKAPLYEVDATILIKDDKKGAGLSELSAFEDLGLLKNSNSIDNEIEVLKSRSLMNLVVQELRLNVRYFVEHSPIAVEKFENAPIYVRFLAGDSAIYNAKDEFVIVPKSNL